MKKRGSKFNLFVKPISLFQIFLLISFTFSFSVILNSGFVSANHCPPGVPLYLDESKKTYFGHTCGPAPETSETSQAGTGNDATNKDAAAITSAGIPVSSFNRFTTPVGATATIDFGNGKVVTGVIEDIGGKLSITDQDKNVIGISQQNLDSANYDSLWAGMGRGFTGNLAEGALWAIAVVGIIQGVGSVFGVDDDLTNALSKSAAAGILAGKAFQGAAEQWPELFKIFGEKDFGGLTNSFWAGVGVSAITFILSYKKDKQETVLFECLPWQAPTGGNDCERCNEGDLPCSEYQCRSLGQACQIINAGTTEEMCTWVNKNDVNPPVIQPWQDALLVDYSYSPDNAVNPPDRGVKVLYDDSNDNCVPAFTPLSFGVTLDEPGKCKLDVIRKQNFSDMTLFMSSGMMRYNHSYALTLPSAESLAAENITIQNDGNFEVYVRCEDANGNSNIGHLQFKYCVDPGPDTTAPLIVASDPPDGLPVAFNQSSVNATLYINEYADCRWDHNDRSYDTMENSMTCADDVFQHNAQMLYKCSTVLTGINDESNNLFYFRCKDKPGANESSRNVNMESYSLSVIGTQPLAIDEVTPNDEVISDSTNAVKVVLEATTSAGYDEGEAICRYSDEETPLENYVEFFNTSSYAHSQELFLTEGYYEYFVNCFDLGGNSDTEMINFTVETDLSAPLIVRAYKEDNFLKLITSEEAECVYSTFECNYEFDEGTRMTNVGDRNHFAGWDNPSSNLYVKCEDNFGNKPAPDQCSIVVRASDF